MSELQAGRELDALIAEKVMGLEWTTSSLTGSMPIIGSPFRIAERSDFVWRSGWRAIVLCPSYSTDMAAAWLVFVAALQQVGSAAILADMEDFGRGLITRGQAEGVVTVVIGEVTVTDVAPLAICRAALAAVEAL